MHRFGGDGMLEAQLRRVQEQTRTAAQVGDGIAAGGTVIDLFGADGMSRLGEVDADLVGAACLQAAGKQGVAGQSLDHLDMSDCLLADSGEGVTAAPAVAPVASEEGFDRLGLDPSMHEREIAAEDAMLAKLQAQAAFGVHGAAEDDQAAGFLVEPLHDAEARFAALPFFGEASAGLPEDEVVERGDQEPAFLLPLAFGGVANGRDAGGLFDDDDVIVDVANDDAVDELGAGRRVWREPRRCRRAGVGGRRRARVRR